MTERQAVFRCDANADIGGGHVVRSMGLAEALERDGWTVGFAVSSATLSAVPDLGRHGWAVVEGFDGTDEAKRYVTEWPGGVDLAIIDHYERNEVDEAALAGWAARRLVLDDCPIRKHACEFLVDQTIGRSPQDYAGLVPEFCRTFAGAFFAILRPDFARFRSRLIPAAAGLNRIVVSFGMIDAANMSATVLDGLAQGGFSGAVDVVVGPAAPHLEALRRTVAERPHPHSSLELHAGLDANAMASLLARSDLAIGAPGSSTYERCCLGVPSLLVTIADNQRDNMVALENAGAARALGWWENVRGEQVAAAVQALAADSQCLKEMRRAALRQTDGRGAQRIAIALRPPRTADGAAVELQPARFEDAELLHRWQQARETRRFARNPKVPTWPEHERWLRAKLDDSRVAFSIVIVGGAPGGVLRFDCVQPLSDCAEAYEVSILVAPNFYRRGVGLAALEAGRRLLPDAELQAVVLPDNVASHKLFKRAGYRWFEDRYLNLPAS